MFPVTVSAVRNVEHFVGNDTMTHFRLTFRFYCKKHHGFKRNKYRFILNEGDTDLLY
jgi:hypothetical protein